MKIKALILILLSFLCLGSIEAQKNNRKVLIQGTVHDIYRSPVANAIVMIDGKKTSSTTDSKGNFKVRVRPGASEIGIFTFGNGIIQQEINGRTHIDIDFSSISRISPTSYNPAGDMPTNVGYGYLKQRNLSNQISSISGRNRDYSSYTSIYDMIKREVPGVRINGNKITIHNSSNFEGYIEPLMIVDGTYVRSIDDVKPATVESIDILKDAAATIYGSRAMGGVIIIRTKIAN
jgi:TonB-dependent starch-binding outer membrane protein SusC